MQPPGILDTGHGEEEGGRVRGGEIETIWFCRKSKLLVLQLQQINKTLTALSNLL